jgi:23S rRNA G2445 N2-methylase RlmL
MYLLTVVSTAAEAEHASEMTKASPKDAGDVGKLVQDAVFDREHQRLAQRLEKARADPSVRRRAESPDNRFGEYHGEPAILSLSSH